MLQLRELLQDAQATKQSTLSSLRDMPEAIQNRSWIASGIPRNDEELNASVIPRLDRGIQF